MRWTEFPSIDVLAEVAPDVVSQLPEKYLGKNTDKNVAEAFATTLKRKTFDEIRDTDIHPSMEGYLDSRDGKTYATHFSRYALDVEDESIFWDFYALTDSMPSRERVFYLVNLAAHYQGAELQKVMSTVSSIYRYQRKNLELADADVTFPTIAGIREVFELARILRAEGVVMESQFLWVASSHWRSDEVISLIEENLPIARALQLYQLGFTTIEEIVSYDNMIPSSWIDRIFSDTGMADIDDSFLDSYL
jgi:hypothetical protein